MTKKQLLKKVNFLEGAVAVLVLGYVLLFMIAVCYWADGGFNAPLNHGQCVFITKGPFAGKEGTVVIIDKADQKDESQIVVLGPFERTTIDRDNFEVVDRECNND